MTTMTGGIGEEGPAGWLEAREKIFGPWLCTVPRQREGLSAYVVRPAAVRARLNHPERVQFSMDSAGL